MTGILGAVAGAHATSGSGGGGGSVSVTLSDQDVFRSSFHTATASYTVANDGTVTDSTSILETWLHGSGASAANYEVYASVSSGSLSSGSTGSWLNLGTSRGWSVANSAQDNSTLTAVIAVQIRDVATHTVQDSASITLSAESDDLGGGGGL